MSLETVYIAIGFCVAAYSIIGNDTIQTLGPFLSSNSKRPWWLLWAFASIILAIVMIYGWYAYNGDVSYGRLDSIPVAPKIEIWHILPPFVLMILTYLGMPVSTTFLILSVFSPSFLLGKMIVKSVVGYGIAFIAAIILWTIISKKVEKLFINSETTKRRWIIAQWAATAFLWSQWLIQDLANIYVFLPRRIDFQTLMLTLTVMIVLLAVIFRNEGGRIQKIVTRKINTQDIRSAALIDALYASVLLVFKEWNNLPMSTTWVFLGVLAGREYAINHSLKLLSLRITFRETSSDLMKATAGMVISVIFALIFKQAIMGDASISAPAPEKTSVEKIIPRGPKVAEKAPFKTN